MTPATCCSLIMTWQVRTVMMRPPALPWAVLGWLSRGHRAAGLVRHQLCLLQLLAGALVLPLTCRLPCALRRVSSPFAPLSAAAWSPP